MKKLFKLIAAVVFSVSLFSACKKEIKEPQASAEEISAADISAIKKLGFGTRDLVKVKEGYLVEGDILLTPEHLKSNPKVQKLRIGSEEQYRTFNTVYNLPRTITVRVSSSLNSSYITAVNTAIARYNALNLLIKFSRVTTGGNIVLTAAPSSSSFLASAGFPMDNGQPWNAIKVNVILNSWNANTKASILAHEMGHCIGMRHTDFYNRAISCGGAYTNEGDGGIGFKYIPGTPNTASWAGASWMLACINDGMNRPFTSSDRIALNYLY
jgi:hypothetical protein